MQIQLKDNKIIGYAELGGFPDGVEVSEEYINRLNKDKIGYLTFNGIDKEPTFDEKAYNEDMQKEQIADLRQNREAECFPIINRGQPWYDTLTEEHKTELNTWYQAWLEVTETKIIPIKPEWLY